MFQEYPKKMHHPDHRDAIWSRLPGKGTGLFVPDTVCTSPERFPDVTVTNLDQERYYASRGYRPNNIPDPVAYEQAILDAQPTTGYVHQEFPKWKYHALEIPVIVKSKKEETLLGEGWHDAPVIATEDDLAVLAVNKAAEQTTVTTTAGEPSVIDMRKKATPAKQPKKKPSARNRGAQSPAT